MLRASLPGNVQANVLDYFLWKLAVKRDVDVAEVWVEVMGEVWCGGGGGQQWRHRQWQLVASPGRRRRVVRRGVGS